jgi:hypothetical protein
LVIDSAILIAAALGRSAPAIVQVSRARQLVLTDRTLEEASRRLSLGLKRDDLVQLAQDIAAIGMQVRVDDLGEPLLARAERVLCGAPLSRNGNTSDAHVLALAFVLEADIWTHDRDFAGTGVASWSTANLLRALAAEPADSANA